MSNRVLHLYQSLPYPLRCLVASLRGLHLRRWRYGPETEQLVQEALERENWNQEQWHQWQQERLKKILHGALTKVPYYREFWEKQKRAGAKLAWEDLRNWPILQKETVRTNPRAFLADDANPGEMFHQCTSGTSGKPLDIWLSRQAITHLYALFEARVRKWNGVSRKHRVATLGGQLVAPVHRRRPPFWVWNAALSQLYMSSYHLAPDLIPAYLDALRSYRVEYIFGYVSSLHALAQGILKSGRTDIRMKVALTNAEPLYAYQSEAISNAFQCPVRETYGNAEVVSAGAQCAAGKLHLWPELGVVEVMAGDQPAAEGTAGDLVFTGITNPMMPLIRYRIGDRGHLSIATACSCGRTLPILESIEGRDDDILFTVDGRQIGRLDPVFKANLPIAEAQIVQETLSRIRVRYVPAEGYSPSAGQVLIERLRERMGPVDVVLEPVPEVPRERGGKFRAVICRVSREAGQRMARGIQTEKLK